MFKKNWFLFVVGVLGLIVLTGAVISCSPPKMSVTIKAAGQGSTNPQSGNHSIEKGTTITVTASPANGWMFDSWSISGGTSSKADKLVVKVNLDTEVTANFVQLHSLTILIAGKGRTNPKPGVYSHVAGKTVTITVESWSDQAEFNRWKGSVNTEGKQIVIIMDSSKEVTAVFGVEESILKMSAVAAGGQAIQEAAAYNKSLGMHHVVLLASFGGIHNWTQMLPKAWWPKAITDTELVALVGELMEQELQTCFYRNNAPPIVRYRLSLDVRLVSAKTGRVVAQTTLYGSIPRACDLQAPWSMTRLAGSTPALPEVKEWLEQF